MGHSDKSNQRLSFRTGNLHNFTIIDKIKYKTITAKFYLLHILTTFKTLVTKKIKKLIVIKFTILTTYRDSDMINSDKTNFISFYMKAL